MNAWELSLDFKDVVLDFAWLSLFLIFGTILRRYGKFFQKYLIPNNIIAGFIGLILGPEIIKLIPLNGDRLGMYVYHLLAITFVAVGLRKKKSHWGKGPLSKALANLSGIIIQGIIGLAVTFLFIYTVKPDLFPAIGLLLPLGFGNGPGLAYALGNSWEKYGFVGGGDVGLTFAAIGYLFAYFIGIMLIYRGIKNRETRLVKGFDGITKDMRQGVIKEDKPRVAGYLTLSTEAIEPLAFQIATIGIVYLFTYWIVWNLTNFMERVGAGGFVPTVWSFHFLIALLIALSVRKILDFTKKSYLLDKGLMNRLAGVSVDYLVVAAICAISLKIVWMYWAPILIMSVVGALTTYYMLRYVCWRAFDDYHFERFIALWGELTGTLNSALVLLRVTDPEFETPVAEDMVYGSGIGLFLGLPVLILLTVPMNFFNNELYGYWIVLGLITAYLFLIWGFWRLIGFIKFKNPYSKTVE